MRFRTGLWWSFCGRHSRDFCHKTLLRLPTTSFVDRQRCISINTLFLLQPARYLLLLFGLICNSQVAYFMAVVWVYCNSTFGVRSRTLVSDTSTYRGLTQDYWHGFTRLTRRCPRGCVKTTPSMSRCFVYNFFLPNIRVLSDICRAIILGIGYLERQAKFVPVSCWLEMRKQHRGSAGE